MKKSITKILLAHSSNDLYGASKILINIIELLINEGHKVYLFLPEKGPLHENNIIKKCNINVLELGVFRKRYFNLFGLINRFYHIIKSTFAIRRFIFKNKIERGKVIIPPAITKINDGSHSPNRFKKPKTFSGFTIWEIVKPNPNINPAINEDIFVTELQKVKLLKFQ